MIYDGAMIIWGKGPLSNIEHLVPCRSLLPGAVLCSKTGPGMTADSDHCCAGMWRRRNEHEAPGLKQGGMSAAGREG